MTISAFMAVCAETKHGNRFRDLTGQRFGLLTAARFSHTSDDKHYYRCLCACGGEATVRGEHLKQGRTVSCGCQKRQNAKAIGTANTTHGASSSGGSRAPTAEYLTWKSMKDPCDNPKHKSYGRYGGRGIVICPRWRTFEYFLEDMGKRPSLNHSIDRYPDNDGNYEPGNCRWATPDEQRWNQQKSDINAARDAALKEI